VSVDAGVISSRGEYSFGIVCRASPSARYRLEARSDGVFLISRSAKLLAKSFGNRVSRSTNHLRADCTGGHGGPLLLRLTLNGKTLSATDKHPLAASGGVGIDAVAGSKGNAELRFDNFTVRKP